MLDVSVIMPIYNVEKYLEKAIKSVLNQTNKNFELILVNDGSTDDALKICRYYEKKDNRVFVINQENKGAGYARNVGLSKATGSYIYFIDPDDYVEPNLIEENIKIAKETCTDVLMFGFIEVTTSIDESSTSRVNLPKLTSSKEARQFRTQFNRYYSFAPYALWNKLYRREFLIKNNVQFSNQKIGEDALFNLDVYRHLEKVEINPHAYYHYVYRANSAVNHYTKDRFKQEYKVAKSFEKLMKEWDEVLRYKTLINKEYWNTMYLEIKNLSSKECMLKKEEKIKLMVRIMENEKIERAVIDLSNQAEKNRFVKTLLFLVKKKKYSLALNLMRLRMDIGFKSQKLLNIIKRLGYKKGDYAQ
ncbi:glycosyltransferase family 2 protein [Carnobacterium sp.]|uniref:glycosyltransferase family 2 protein n=1 Tax=Carnobacterium sp. TaxID=48221 RepID=UPI003C7321BC